MKHSRLKKTHKKMIIELIEEDCFTP